MFKLNIPMIQPEDNKKSLLGNYFGSHIYADLNSYNEQQLMDERKYAHLLF